MIEWLRRLFSGDKAAAPTGNVPKPPATPPGTSSLSGLLDALEEVAASHPELLDTDVRERMWEVVEQRFVHLNKQFTVPDDLGMFTAAGNARLHHVLEHHVNNLVTIAKIFRLDTEAKRLRTLRNPAVKSEPGGHTYDYFLGG